MTQFAFRGEAAFIEAVTPRLEAAGFTREGEIEAAEIVLTYCANAQALEDMYLDRGGIVQHTRPGCVIVDLSPATPNFARDLCAICAVNDISMIEAPIFVKNTVAPGSFEQGNLGCFVSVEGEVSPEKLEILHVIASDVTQVGGPGAAQLSRAALTIQRVAEIIAAIESRALFQAAKLTVTTTEMGTSSVVPTSPEAYEVLRAVADERFAGAYTTSMLMGELTAALMAADDFELIIPQAEAAMHLLELLAVIGGADMSPAAMALAYSDDETVKKFGLDWDRANKLYAKYDEGVTGDSDLDDDFDDLDEEFSDTKFDFFETDDGFNNDYFSN